MAAIVQAAQKGHWRERFGAQVAAVISNKAEAAGLAFAREHHIATAALDHKAYASREDFDAALMGEIDHYTPVLVVLAGFMRILTPGFVTHYAGRLVNIHPSLLPAFAGLQTHQRAIDAGCKFAGCTVHRVTADRRIESAPTELRLALGIGVDRPPVALDDIQRLHDQLE